MLYLTLKNSLKNTRCPICTTIEEEFKTFLWWFEREGYKEISSLNTLKNASFICKRHEHELYRLKDKLNNTFEYIVREDAKFLLLLKELPAKKRKKLLKQEFNCRFCIEEKRIEELAIDIFAKDKKIHQLYLKSNSILCKKHLFMILSQTKNQILVENLLEKTLKFLEAKSIQINNFFKKIDYLSSEQPSAEEKEAYIQLLEIFYSNY